MDLLSFPAVLGFLSTYWVVERGMKKTFEHVFPDVYEKLYRERKDQQYFVFIMGIMLVLVSTPACVRAFGESTSANDILGQPNVSTAGKLCIAAKGVLWSSELNRLDHSMRYIEHHLASIGYLVYHLYSAMPLRIIYAFYASLVTELISDTACLLTLHGLTPENSVVAYRVQATNVIVLACIRIPPCIYAASIIPDLHSVVELRFWINIVCLLIYTRFNTNAIIAVSKRLQIIRLTLNKPVHLQLFRTYNFSLYSIFFSIASFATAILAFKVYVQSSSSPPGSIETSFLGFQILLTGAAGVIGARLPSAIISQSARNGLWIQGGMLASAASIVLSPIIDRNRLFSSLALALPLGEAIGRIGCHYAGCCGSPLLTRISLQLRCSLLNAIAGVVIITLYHLNVFTLERAAFTSVAANAAIRVVLRANVFALAQLCGALGMFALSGFGNNSSQKTAQAAGPTWDALTEDVEIRKLENAWILVFASSAIVAGCFVQGGCQGGPFQGSNGLLAQGCNSTFAQGCNGGPIEAGQGCNSNAVQGCNAQLTQGCNSVQLQASQGCNGGPVQGCNVQLAHVFNGHHAQDGDRYPVQGCNSIPVVQGLDTAQSALAMRLTGRKEVFGLRQGCNA